MKLRTFTQGAECNVQPRHFSQVKEHECCIPTTEIEEIAGGRLLPEPRKDAAALYFDENIEKGLEIDDISSMFHYGLKSYRGGLDPNTPAEGKHELKCGAFDGMLHDDEVPHLQPHMGLTNACEDYFLDFDLTKKVPELDYRFCEESGTEDSSESNTPAACNEAVGLAGLHIPEPDCQPDRFGKITASQIHGSSGTSSTCGCTLRVEDEMHLQCSASLKDYKMKQVSRATGSMESGYRREKNINIVHFRIPERMSWVPRDAEYDNIASSECEAEEKDMHDVFIGRFDGLRDVAPLLRQKRSRKPPQRYIEERTHSMSQNLKGRKQSSASSKKGKHPVLKSQNNRWHKGVKMALLVSHGGSPGRSPRPVPFLEHQDVSMRCLPKKEYSVKHPTKKEASKKYGAIVDFDSDDEYVPVYSNPKKRISEKTSDRRKRNKLWSLPEVVKLVDGISQFGVGKWTAIRRTFFSSSSYRTSLDIRDKWRNLLRASYAQLKDGAQDEPRTNGSQPLPKSLLRRVSDLATLYPYPRQGSKLSRTTKQDLCLLQSE